MEATLEAVKRSDRGKNEARRLRAAGSLPAVVYGARVGDAVPVAMPVSVDPKTLMRILHSDSGVNTLIKLKRGGRGDVGAGEGIPARSRHQQAAARRLLPAGDGQAADRDGAGRRSRASPGA